MAQFDGPSSSSSSSPPPPPPDLANEKPVIVRVKRKLTQARFDAFWLEINERPSKKALLDFGTLSISDSTTQNVEEEPKSKKLFVHHVETITESDAIGSVLHSFLTDSNVSKEKKIEERKRAFKLGKKPDELKQGARQKHEEMARHARFEQIWKSRKDSLKEVCHLYDVLQVDATDDTPSKTKKKRDIAVEEEAILCNYLPLLREHIPSAATTIESDIFSVYSEEDYVYDLYTVEKDGDTKMEDIQANYPLVQVDNGDDDDYYDGPPKSDYDTDDSNAEDNPAFDYPEEEDSDEEEERDPFDYFENDSDAYEVVEFGSDEDEEREVP
ncbi:RNA-directed DNA methylation 4 [Rhynchospora pubera]|uniref:RNA-directed DNA methylation 4 n=1 Tax=Rhynchospora pubera TaxID=906938 RepID=A0AAV8GWT7_9POAL|nr:RNA-directed DNA methylation 4 [Rhynchospora pubera]KAJ4807488.1 RNA-directed DNA methylation 4 [Rhynchospora pubera]